MPTDMWPDLVNKARSLCFKGMPETVQMTFQACSQSNALEGEIREGEHYFGMTLNEIRLQHGQEFYVTYDPLVYLAVDFRYGSQRVTVPRLIGPSAIVPLMKVGGDGVPHGFALRNIRVIGPLPYRGDPVGITLVLYKVAHTNYARRVLAFAEKLSSVIGFPADISTAFKIGESIVDAIETLFDMKDSVPLMGRRFELNASPKDGLQPQHVALVNGGADQMPSLGVKDGALVRSTGGRFGDRDYVLFNLWRAESRGTDTGLPTDSMVEKLYECGLAGDAESWRRGKSILITLYQQLLGNVDLTEPDAERIFEKYKQKLIKCRERSGQITLMSEAEKAQYGNIRQSEVARLNEKSREVFDLPD